MSRRSVLAAGLTALAGLGSGCTTAGPVRIDGAVAVPTPPPPSAGEVARRRLAGASQALLSALLRVDPAAAPGDIGPRLTGWTKVHRTHLVTLAEPAAVAPPGLGVVGASGAGALAATDPVLTATGLLRAMAADAVDVSLSDAALGPLALRIATARSAQDQVLRAQTGQPVPLAPWPPDAPVEPVQALLAAEHAVIDGYTTAAARAVARRGELERRRREHETIRDTLTALLAAAGHRPVPAEPGYALPADVAPDADPDTRAVQLAVIVETGALRTGLAAATAVLSAVDAPGDLRLAMLRSTVALLGDIEAARQRWGAEPDPLPGS